MILKQEFAGVVKLNKKGLTQAKQLHTLSTHVQLCLLEVSLTLLENLGKDTYIHTQQYLKSFSRNKNVVSGGHYILIGVLPLI